MKATRGKNMSRTICGGYLAKFFGNDVIFVLFKKEFGS